MTLFEINMFNKSLSLLTFISGKMGFLTKFKTKSMFQKYAEVFEDETATAEEVEQKGLRILMLR